MANHRSATPRVRLRAEEVYPTRQHRGWDSSGIKVANVKVKVRVNVNVKVNADILSHARADLPRVEAAWKRWVPALARHVRQWLREESVRCCSLLYLVAR